MGILDEYMKQREIDSENIDNNVPIDGIKMSDEDYDRYCIRLNEIRKEIDESEKIYNPSTNENKNTFTDDVMMSMFNMSYNKTTESELNVVSDEVRPVIKRAYCPKCGNEIISMSPVIFNPFTMERICRYDCKCGWKANLDYAYPRVVFVDNDNNEFDAYAK